MKKYLLTILTVAAISLPAMAESKADTFGFKFSATAEMQVQKDLYGQFSGSTNLDRLTTDRVTNYRELVDDFWMRAAFKGMYRTQYLEGVFNVRFYPYWTMRQNYLKINNNDPNVTGGKDLLPYISIFELNQAYFKVFKTYTPKQDLTFQPSFKVGRDGLQNSSSELFGNYLDLPTGGYGQSSANNIIGPFLNRKVFANQIEAAFAFNVFNKIGGNTSVMIGGNVNNEKFYDPNVNGFYQLEDSKLSAGFYRIYQDLYFLNKRVHLGGGVREYTTMQDSLGSGDSRIVKSTYFTAQGALDIICAKDVKFYTEIAMQKMSSDASTGIVRPINVGITLPTFGVVDSFALECENVGKTYMLHNPIYTILNNESFFDPRSMRDPQGGGRSSYTQAFGWGMVIQKKYANRLNVAWGLYTSNPYQDMSTTLRFSTYF